MMSKKNLLNESQIRQFMKLASLEPLTPGFVRGLAESSASKEDLEEVRNGSPAPGLDSGRRGHGRGRGPEDRLEEEEVVDDLETEIGDDMAAAELDVEEPVEEPVEMEPEGDEGRLVAVDDFLAALESALEDVMGDEVEIDADDLEAEVEDEGEMDLAPDGGEEVEMDAEEELMETGADCSDDEASDELVEQITKRVAARILKSALAKK